MSTETRHIRRIVDAEATIRASLDDAQIAILTDADEEFVYTNDDASKLYYAANQFHWNGSTIVYEDTDFGEITAHDDILVDEYIKLSSVTDNYIRLEDEKISIGAGGVVSWVFEDDQSYTMNNVGIGTNAPSQILEIKRNQNNITRVDVINETDGAASQATYYTKSNVASGGFGSYSSTSTSPELRDKVIAYSLKDLALFALDSEVQIYSGGIAAANKRVVINSSGNVGIGVFDPDTPLEILSTSSQLKLSYDSTKYATIGVDTDENITITPNNDIILMGQVGINTTSPEAMLGIKKSDLDTGMGMIIENLNTGTSSSARIQLRGYQCIGTIDAYGSGYTMFPQLTDKFVIQAGATASALVLQHFSTGDIQFYIGPGSAATDKKLNLSTTDLTLSDGVGLNLQEDITFTGAQGENIISCPSAESPALKFTDSAGFEFFSLISVVGAKEIRLNDGDGDLLFTMYTDDGSVGFRVDGAANSGAGGVYANLKILSTHPTNYSPVYIDDDTDELYRYQGT